MYIRKRYKKLSIISEFIIITLVLGAFLVLLENKAIKNENEFPKNNTSIEENEYKPQNIFAAKKSDRKTELNHISSNILDKTDINVYYGDETKGVGNVVDGIELYDEDIIYNNMKTLEESLNKYPEGFFKEFKNSKKNYSISIYFIDKFNNDNIALATRNNKNDFKVYLSSREDLENVIHHELFHIIEYYLQLEYNSTQLFEKWNKYNPEGYIYPHTTKNIDSKFVHEEKYTKENVYFVTRYAKTTEKEDRAETFSDLMRGQEKPYYYKNGYAINDKANVLSTILEDKFISVKNSVIEHWERFIK